MCRFCSQERFYILKCILSIFFRNEMADFDLTSSLALNHSNGDQSHSDDKKIRKRLIWCFWSFFLILLPSSSIVLSGYALFGSSTTAFNEKGRVADILLMITYTVAVYGIIKTIRSHTASNPPKNSASAHTENHSNIVLTFIFILGVGDSLFIMTRFGDQLILVTNKNYASDSQCSVNIGVSMLANSLKSLCQLCILMFIVYQLNHSIKFRCQTSKIFLTCLAIFCLIEWIQILLQEVHHHKKKPDSCSLFTSQGLKQFNKITPYLYPLGLEYRFAAFIELLIMSECFRDNKENFVLKFYNWLKEKVPCKCCTSKIKLPTINNCLKKVLSIISNCFRKIQSPLGKDDILFPLILLPTGGVFLVSLSIVIVLFQEFNMDDGDHRVTEINNKSDLLTLISEVCEIILTLIISLHSIYSLDKLCKKVDYTEQKSPIETVNVKFKIDFSFLFIANLFLNIYCVLTLVGSIKSKPESKLTQYIRWLTLTASVIPIIQTMIQLIVIWKVRHHNGKLTKGINQMWIILSFAVWLFDTFSAKGFNTNQIQIHVYSGSWDVLAALFIPMAIFFSLP